MFEALKLITLATPLAGAAREDFRRALEDATAALPAVRRYLLEPVLPGGYDAGDLIWRVSFADEQTGRRALAERPWRDVEAQMLGDRSRVARLQHAAWTHAASGGISPGRGVYRVALFCANRSPSTGRLAQFEAETRAMPLHIRSICSWQLATTCEGTGSRHWTHVWQQEYASLDGLAGTYMMHPWHWAHVDRWFDPEWPEWLVDPVLCHAFCASPAPVIGPCASMMDPP